MKCPFCNSILENGYCKSCERQIHELYRHPKKAEHEEKPENEEVIEPEIVDEEETNSQRAYRNFRQSPLFTQYAFTNVNMHDSCLTGIISFGLIFFVFSANGFFSRLRLRIFHVYRKNHFLDHFRKKPFKRQNHIPYHARCRHLDYFLLPCDMACMI